MQKVVLALLAGSAAAFQAPAAAPATTARGPPYFLHVTLICDDTVLNRVLQRQDATLTLHFTTHVLILRLDDTCTMRFGPTNDGRKAALRHFLASPASFA